MKKLLAVVLSAAMLFQTGALAKEINTENFNIGEYDSSWQVDDRLQVTYEDGSDYSENAAKCFKLSSGEHVRYSGADWWYNTKNFVISFDAMITGSIKIKNFVYRLSDGAVVPGLDNIGFTAGDTQNGITIEGGEWASYKYDINLATGVYKLYVNGQQFGMGAATPASKNGNLFMYVTGDAYIDNFSFEGGDAEGNALTWTPDTELFQVHNGDGCTEAQVKKPENIPQTKVLMGTYSGSSRGQLARYYPECASGTVTIEYKYLVQNAEDLAGGIECIFYGGGVTANIQADGFINFNGQTAPVGFGSWTTVKMVLDMTSHTYDAYINGEAAASGCSFGGSIANMVVWLNPGSKIYLDDISIKAEEQSVFLDNFEGANGWNAVYEAEMAVVTDPTIISDKAVMFTNPTDVQNISASKFFSTAGAETASVEFDAKTSSATVHIGAFDLVFSGGLIYNSTGTPLSCDANWHRHKLVFDTVGEKVIYYIDGGEKASANWTAGLPSDLSLFLTNSSITLDNINISATGGIEASEVKITDANGSEVTEITQNSVSGIRAAAELVNTSALKENGCTLVMAFYKDGRLVGVTLKDRALAAGESCTVETDILDIDTAETGSYAAKAMVWDSIGLMSSLSEVYATK